MFNNLLRHFVVLWLAIYLVWTMPIMPLTTNGFHVQSFRIPANPINNQGYVVRVQQLHSTRPFIQTTKFEEIKVPSPFRLIHSNIGTPIEVVTESSATVDGVEKTLEPPPIEKINDEHVPDQNEVEVSIESLVTLITLINTLLEELTGESYLKENILKQNEVSAKETRNSFTINNNDNTLILTSESITHPDQYNSEQVKQAMAVLNADKLEVIQKLMGNVFNNDTTEYDQTIIDIEKSGITYDGTDVNWLDQFGGSGNDGRINNVDENGHSTDKLVRLNDLPENLKQSPDAGLEQVKLTEPDESNSSIRHSADQLIKVENISGVNDQLLDGSSDKHRKLKFISVPKP